MGSITIRPEQAGDEAAVADLLRLAFGGDEEVALVERLRSDGDVVLSLVAIDGQRNVGHILFSPLVIHSPARDVPAIALAPVAVLPSHQNRGIGTRLVCEGLDRARHAGHRIVAVLGHPEYYPRFGFSAEAAKPLEVPFAGPAWMALELAPGSLEGVSGRVEYPPAFGIGTN